jgi:hypothetical protein
MDNKPAPQPTPQPGQLATVDGKGPFYIVQIEGDTATLQGSETFTAPVSSLKQG